MGGECCRGCAAAEECVEGGAGAVAGGGIGGGQLRRAGGGGGGGQRSCAATERPPVLPPSRMHTLTHTLTLLLPLASLPPFPPLLPSLPPWDDLCRLLIEQMTVDLLGVVTEVKPLGSVKRKSDQAELSRRDLTLVDQRWALALMGAGRVLVGAGR